MVVPTFFTVHLMSNFVPARIIVPSAGSFEIHWNIFAVVGGFAPDWVANGVRVNPCKGTAVVAAGAGVVLSEPGPGNVGRFMSAVGAESVSVGASVSVGFARASIVNWACTVLAAAV